MKCIMAMNNFLKRERIIKNSFNLPLNLNEFVLLCWCGGGEMLLLAKLDCCAVEWQVM